MVLRAREIMTRRVVTVRPDSPIALAAERLAEFRFSALPVVDDAGRLVGIVSVVDLLRHREEPDAEPSTTVGSVMTTDVLSMSPTANVGILAHRLRTYGELRVMPIVERGVLVGVVTRSDLIRPRASGGSLARFARRVLGRGRPEAEAPPSTHRSSRPASTKAPGDLLVRDVMTRTGLVTITESTSTERAAELLTTNRFTAVPVVGEGDRLVGIVSEADLLRDPLDGRRFSSPRTAGGVMTSDVVVLAPDAGLDEARRLVADRGLRVVPVVDEGRLVGVVSRSDLV